MTSLLLLLHPFPSNDLGMKKRKDWRPPCFNWEGMRRECKTRISFCQTQEVSDARSKQENVHWLSCYPDMFFLMLLCQVKGCNEASVTVKQSREKIMKEKSDLKTKGNFLSHLHKHRKRKRPKGSWEGVSLLFPSLFHSFSWKSWRELRFFRQKYVCPSLLFLLLLTKIRLIISYTRL